MKCFHLEYDHCLVPNSFYRKVILLLLSVSGPDVLPTLSDQEPTSSENTLTLMDDSGCVLSNEQRNEPAELSQHFVESTDPPLLPLPLEKRPRTTLENPLSSHMQFFQHLLELKKWTESSSLKVYLTHFEKDSSTVSDSVSQLLDALITFYRNPKLPFSSFWTEAVGTLARLASDFNLSNHIFKRCSKKLEEFEKTLLQAILENNSINRVSNIFFLLMTQCLIHFYEHSYWRSYGWFIHICG
jgi:hypothetical protein